MVNSITCATGQVNEQETELCSETEFVFSVNKQVREPLFNALQTSFFRYFRINLSKPCPFWKESMMCTNEGCAIATLPKDPNGWEAQLSDIHFPTFQLAGNAFPTWENENHEFCFLDQVEEKGGVYVDLIENPERFTGYSGPSANRIWTSIYEENCFHGATDNNTGLVNERDANGPWKNCVEKRLFYKVVSGLHASVSVHLADQFFNQQTKTWESNYGLYYERVGRHPERKTNLFLVFMLLYKAVCRMNCQFRAFVSLNDQDPEENRQALHLLDMITRKSDPSSMLGKCLFASTKPEIINEFRDHFRNVTKIMNCVSCERCRLWGSIQTIGIGTALKILSYSEDDFRSKTVKLRRSEIIALVNTLGRFSESITAIEKFESNSSKTSPFLLRIAHRAKTLAMDPSWMLILFTMGICFTTAWRIRVKRRHNHQKCI